MTEFIGKSGNHALFADEAREHAVIVDSRVSLVVATGNFSTLYEAQEWEAGSYADTDVRIAYSALDDLMNPDPEPTGRMYTIPRGAQVNARKALTAAAGEGPVARYYGTVLAAGGQVSFNQLGQIAAFFSEEQDEDSNLWRLYGGHPAKKWATSIFEREALTASAPPAPENLAQLLADNPEAGPEFLVRLSTVSGVMDRLYRIDLDKRTYVWDASAWTDLGQTEWDIWDYDFALDGKQPNIDQTHIMIDPESALHAASLISKGMTTFTVEDIAPVEAMLAVDALADEDWATIDSITAAVGPGSVDGDGIYSEEERSSNASKQVRDGRGQFAKMGSTVMVNGNPQQTGKISRVNGANGTVEVSLNDGTVVTVPGNQVEAASPAQAPAPGQPLVAPTVDFSGILAEPRTPITREIAQLQGTLPQISRKDLKAIIDSFPAWVKRQRDSFKGDRVTPEPGSTRTATSQRSTSYDHPLLNVEMAKSKRAVTAAAVADAPVDPNAKPVDVDPNTSDVQPVYMAIVSPDDPRAVFKLISLVPANSKSNQPMVYSREEGEWVRDEATLGDLKSATPPPVVALDESTLDDVLVQVDGSQGVGEEPEMAAQPVSVPTEPDPGSVVASGIDENLALMVLWGPNKDIMAQALTAAGGADRNRGGAEKLRRYWTVGEGGLKIRWNTPGDWTRCVRQLSKHLGPRARGYCALRHKEMTHHWTGDKEHLQKFSANTPVALDSTNVIKTTDDINDYAWMNAQAGVLFEAVHSGLTASAQKAEKYQVFPNTKEGLVAAAAVVPTLDAVGGRFLIPLVIPEELESGDGREVERYALDTRNLPLPLMWQIHTGQGHDGAVVVGRIDSMGRTPQGIGMAMGYFDVGPYGREAERMVRAGMLRHVSADMDKFEAEQEEAAEKSGKIAKSKLSIKKARVMGATIVAKPAFQECTIVMAPERELIMEDDVLPDGIITEEVDPMEAVALVAAGYIADAIPVVPPRAWFENPELKRPTPLTVDDDGRVFGHVAAWGTAHMNAALNGVNPPRSASGYAYFNKGVVRTDDGSDVTVGQLTLVGGHADLHFSANEAARHYDDTASAFADVHAGEDQYGIWVAGALRPGVTAEQIRAIRASTPSGDWRPIRGKLELIAVCQVNVPGFPIARAMVASGHTMALTAAGASELARLRPDPILDLARRVQDLEAAGKPVAKDSAVDQAVVASLMARVGDHKARREAELSAKSLEVLTRMESFGYVSKQSREQAADKGEALPDGSYPIRNVEDLKNAIQAYGRAKESERAKVRRHIMKRARALGKADLIPDEWKNAASAAITASVMSMRERVEAARSETALVASVEDDLKRLTPAQRQRLINDLKAKGEEIPEELAPKAQGAESKEDQPAKYKPGYQPRDYNGQFKQVLARLKEDLGDDANQDIVEKIEQTGRGAGDYAESVRAGLDLKSQLDRLDSKALNPEAIGNVRQASRALGKAISNLPLPFENQAAKLRFSDVPPTMRDLMQDLVKRVHEKIGNAEGQKATAKMRSFMSGGDMFSQSEISREMSRFLRLLT